MGALGSDSTDRQFVAIAASIGGFACVALAKNHYPVVQGVMFAILAWGAATQMPYRISVIAWGIALVTMAIVCLVYLALVRLSNYKQSPTGFIMLSGVASYGVGQVHSWGGGLAVSALSFLLVGVHLSYQHYKRILAERAAYARTLPPGAQL
jgi:hypothetical protein